MPMNSDLRRDNSVTALELDSQNQRNADER